MVDTTTPYIPHQPGDLITAEDWNAIQVAARGDIASQVAAAIAKLKDIDHSKNSDQLGGMSLADLTQYILDRAFAQLPKRTGYMRLFCNLKIDAEKIIEHKLGQPPLVDVYQLGYFQALCAKSDRVEDSHLEWVLFYLYHSSERRIRPPAPATPFEVETKPPFRIQWKTVLDQLKEQKLLNYTDDTSLDDLETDFWQALFHDPNDDFDAESYCHSPWFEKCCGEKRSVSDLTKHGDFDDIWLKVVPQKTLNFAPVAADALKPEPSNVIVSQLDFDTVALRLIKAPDFPTALNTPPNAGPLAVALSAEVKQRLAVMALLKV